MTLVPTANRQKRPAILVSRTTRRIGSHDLFWRDNFDTSHIHYDDHAGKPGSAADASIGNRSLLEVSSWTWPSARRDPNCLGSGRSAAGS
jgi:hypothetical protein